MTREQQSQIQDGKRNADRPSNDHPSDQPAGGTAIPDRSAPMAPGDVAPPGTPGTGENVCRMCGGKRQVNGRSCPECQGSGTVSEGIGGA